MASFFSYVRARNAPGRPGAGLTALVVAAALAAGCSTGSTPGSAVSGGSAGASVSGGAGGKSAGGAGGKLSAGGGAGGAAGHGGGSGGGSVGGGGSGGGSVGGGGSGGGVPGGGGSAGGAGGVPPGGGGSASGGVSGSGGSVNAGIMAGVPCGTVDGVEYIERYRSNKSRWCVHPMIWAAHAADVEKFFPFGDQAVSDLETLFALTPKDLPYTIQVTEPTGGAHTSTDFGEGATVTGDAYYNSLGGVKGFWGYLLTLHELINVWTGLVSPGWPTDWWADHRSPFPNSMDYQIMLESGTRLGDATLLAAAKVQHERLGVPGRGDFDTEVKMFDDFFTQYGGFAAYDRVFELIQGDGLRWGGLRDPPAYTKQTEGISGNPSPLLSSYVIAYLSLGFRVNADITPVFVAAGVGTKDEKSTPYTVDPEVVGDVADAHCAIAAATTDVAVARAALRKGDYKTAKVAAACGAKCPAECGCDSMANQCVALWRAK